MVAATLMPVSKKLTRNNHILWRAQVTKAPAEKVHMAKKSGKEEGEAEEESNPAFKLWKAQEQQVLSYLLTSVSHDVLVQISTLSSAADVWKHIKSAFASQSRAWVINTRMTLATTQKGSLTVAEYISKMKLLADDMASAGKKFDDEDFISYILAGLDAEYNLLCHPLLGVWRRSPLLNFTLNS
jgi:K+-sensing histidine kinase KdpD